jgi:hypothetical protein
VDVDGPTRPGIVEDPFDGVGDGPEGHGRRRVGVASVAGDGREDGHLVEPRAAVVGGLASEDREEHLLGGAGDAHGPGIGNGLPARDANAADGVEAPARRGVSALAIRKRLVKRSSSKLRHVGGRRR